MGTLARPTQIVEWTVADEHAWLRVDAFLARQLPWRSRRSLVELLAAGAVVVNGRSVLKKAQRLAPGDVIALEVPLRPEAEIDLGTIALHVVWEDDDLVVVNKPGDLAVHPASTCQYRNLQARLVHHYRQERGEPQVVPSVLHRLDRTTSGVVAFAKRRELVDVYTRQFAARTTHKEYVAIVRGQVPGAMVIEQPIHVPPDRPAWVGPGGKPSRTDVRVLGTRGGCSRLRITLHTGRRHQIRVHLAALGHPLVGDALYGDRRAGEGEVEGARPLLHAASLELHHRDGRRLRFEAPVAQDIEQAWDRLGAHAATPTGAR